ncbi:MAG: hypothetical protein L6420_10470 [Elusimicrobia bacterium]|nr:hypothetical protein [Elusimicrobiota bacterium]
MKKVFLFGFFFMLAANAGAYFDGGVSATKGENGYSGGNVFLIVGFDNIWLKPALNYYKTDDTNGTYKTYSLRGGYDKDLYSIAGGFGTTPEVNGYKNSYAESDITFTLTSNGSRKGRLAGPQSSSGASGGKGLARIDIGGAAKYIMHENAYDVGSVKRTKSLSINQTDLTAFAGASFLKTRLSASYTASSYDKDLAPTNLGAQAVNVTGLTSIVQGFPSSSFNMRLDWSNMPFVAPYVSYTKTKFKLAQDDSKAYCVGAYIDLEMLDINASYEIYDNGSSKDNYVSLGAGIKF